MLPVRNPLLMLQANVKWGFERLALQRVYTMNIVWKTRVRRVSLWHRNDVWLNAECTCARSKKNPTIPPSQEKRQQITFPERDKITHWKYNLELKSHSTLTQWIKPESMDHRMQNIIYHRHDETNKDDVTISSLKTNLIIIFKDVMFVKMHQNAGALKLNPGSSKPRPNTAWQRISLALLVIHDRKTKDRRGMLVLLLPSRWVLNWSGSMLWHPTCKLTRQCQDEMIDIPHVLYQMDPFSGIWFDHETTWSLRLMVQKPKI
jgi:hypothetical protein